MKRAERYSMKTKAFVVTALACAVTLLTLTFWPHGEPPADPIVSAAPTVERHAPPKLLVRRDGTRLGITPVAAGAEERQLPLAGMPAVDLGFLAEAVRLGGGSRAAEIDRLVALAGSGADAATLRAAVERELAGHLALRLAARRWVAARLGEPAPEIVTPKPATALVEVLGQ